MDPLSLTATCISLVSTITKTSLAVTSFVKDVRAARTDLDAVSRELQSLKIVLEILAEDFKDSASDSTNESIPQTLQKQISGIIANCTQVLVDIEQTLKKYEGGKGMKAMKWAASGNSDVLKLQSSLEAHRSALEIALEMVTLNLTRKIKADTQELLYDTSSIKLDTTQILAEIARLQEQLTRDPNQRSTGFMLERYLDNLSSYAETVCDPSLEGVDEFTGSDQGSIKQQDSTPSRPSRNRDSSSESSEGLRVETLDPPVSSSKPEDSTSPNLEEWLLEMKAKVTANDWDADKETAMTYIQNQVEGLHFTHLEPRLRPGCKNPFATRDEMFEVLAQVLTDQNDNEHDWARENQPKPALEQISLKSLALPSAGLPISKTASSSSSATTSQENLNQVSNAGTEGHQKSSTPSLSHKLDTTSTYASPSAETPTSSTDSLNDLPPSNVIKQKPQIFKFSQKLSHAHRVFSAVFSPDGRQLASISDGGTTIIWADKQGTLEQVQELKVNLKGGGYRAVFSPDGRQLACLHESYISIKRVNGQGKFEQVQMLKGHKGQVRSITFSPDGRMLASGAEDKKILVWADRRGKFEQIQELKNHKGTVMSVSFLPDGRKIVSGSVDKTIRIWAARQGRYKEIQELRGHEDEVWSVASSPNGYQLASSDDSKTIRIWEKEEGKFEQVQEIRGVQFSSESVAFSPDGRLLASGHYDYSIRIWTKEGNEFKCIQELEGHSSAVWSVAFSPDGRQLASASRDRTVRIWKLED